MPIFRILALVALTALAACFPVAPQVEVGPGYYVMRHLETPRGVTDPDLTPEGAANAARLVEWFENDPPSVIYVSSTKRAQQTAAPLAQRLGITPKIYDPANTPALVQQVRAEAGTVLVVGHSNTVPDIVQQLGGIRPAPITETQFGDIWHVNPVNSSTLKLSLSGM
jgi:phosphohistidine phosphatase SixA